MYDTSGMALAKCNMPAWVMVQDADDADTEDAAEGGRGAGGAGPAVSYAALYDAMARGLINERAVLLLYDLLHDCQHFHNYILVRR
jgi:hypothetical protein